MPIEPALCVLGTGFAGLGDAPNCDLGREFEALPQIPIAQLVEVEQPNGPTLEDSRSQPITNFIHPLEGAAQDVRFLNGRGELDVSNQLRRSRYSSSGKEKQGDAFVCRLKATVSSGGFL